MSGRESWPLVGRWTGGDMPDVTDDLGSDRARRMVVR